MFNMFTKLRPMALWLAFIATGSLFGQTQKVDHTQFTWFVYDMRAKLNDHWATRLELDGRTYLPSFRLQQALVPRVHLVRKFSQRHSAGAGASVFIQFMPQIDRTDVEGVKTELRLHQDLMPEWDLGKTRMSHRLRFEERFFLPQDGIGQTAFRLRGRYSLQESFPLEPTKQWSLRLGAEVLCQVGEGVNGRYFEQFRGFGAMVWKMNNHWTWDIGYINWWLPQGAGNPVQSRGYVRIAAIHQFSFFKKSG